MAQAEGNGNGRIGQFHGNNVNPRMYGIEPMGAREFGYLPSSNVDDDDTSLYSLLWRDYDSGRRESCMANVLSTVIGVLDLISIVIISIVINYPTSSIQSHRCQCCKHATAADACRRPPPLPLPYPCCRHGR
jgi:hypothetical protein